MNLPTEFSLSDLLELPQTAAASSLSELQKLLDEERNRCAQVIAVSPENLTEAQSDEVRVRFTGRKSPLQDWLKSLRNFPAEERKDAGAKINQLKSFLEGEVERFVLACRASAEKLRLEREKVDLTLPLPELNLGSRHPVSAAAQQLLEPLKTIRQLLL